MNKDMLDAIVYGSLRTNRMVSNANSNIDEEWNKTIESLLRNDENRRTRSAAGIYLPPIVKVIFNNPATIVVWGDKTKTVVKATNEEFDPEKGLAMAISKKAFGNDYRYYNVFEKTLKNPNNYKPDNKVHSGRYPWGTKESIEK